MSYLLRTRWYVLLVGLLLTGAAVAYLFSAPGVYSARTGVIMLGPPSESRPNKLDSNSAGLIATAGVIERELNAGREPGIPAIGNDVTLVDQGIYDGVQIRQPNYGGQWSNNFTEPVLDVQASGASPDVVNQRMAQAIGQIEAILKRRQDEAGVMSSQRISLAFSPPLTQVHYDQGRRTRAGFVATILGLALTWGAAAGMERRRLRRNQGWHQAQLALLEEELVGTPSGGGQ